MPRKVVDTVCVHWTAVSNKRTAQAQTTYPTASICSPSTMCNSARHKGCSEVHVFSRAVHVSRQHLFSVSHALHADSDFLHLGGSELSYCPICTAAVAARSPGTGVSLKSCSFRLPFEAPGSRYIRAFAGGLASASHTLCLSVNPGLILACVKYMHGCERMHVLYTLLKGRADAVISDSPLGVALHALS